MGQLGIDEYYMRLALEQAEVALKNNWIPVGSIFVHNGRIVTHGTKTGLTHTLFDHAEHNGCYQALWSRQGPKNLEGFTVYSTLEPCCMCMTMLMTTRVSRIVYACEDPYGGGKTLLQNPELLPKRFKKEHPSIEGGVLERDSKLLLRRFFCSQPATKEGNWSDPDNPLVRHVMSE